MKKKPTLIDPVLFAEVEAQNEELLRELTAKNAVIAALNAIIVAQAIEIFLSRSGEKPNKKGSKS